MERYKPKNIFYVYEHWRPDKDVCFWVGKGHGNRAYNFRRNFHYNNVVKKLASLGMCVEVRLVQSQLTERQALDFEVDRIAFWRSVKVDIVNYTDGGEGVSGLKHSAKTKALIRKKRKKQVIKHSEETKRKIGAANSIALKGRKNPEHSRRLMGRKHTRKHKAKISAGLMGRVVSQQTRDKIRKSNLNQKRSRLTCRRLRLAHLGKTPTAKTRAKMRASQKKRWAEHKAKLCLQS